MSDNDGWSDEGEEAPSYLFGILFFISIIIQKIQSNLNINFFFFFFIIYKKLVVSSVIIFQLQMMNWL